MGGSEPGIPDREEGQVDMYRLYWAPRTGAFMVEAALAEAGAEVELVRVDKEAGEHLSEEYRTLNPVGQIPVLAPLFARYRLVDLDHLAEGHQAGVSSTG